MKRISRDAIQRMVGGISSSSSFSGSGGGGGGGVSQYWVDDNYVSKEFFNRLFEIHDENGDPILPNDVETEIDNIQAMFGFWTNAYLSALGNNPGGGGAELTLASLADVAVQGVTDGQALVWNATLQKWVPGQGGGIDITAMWAALAQSGTQQIDASHLGTALTGYATETWVGNQGYITGSALNGYATESWVGSQISDMATQTWVSGNYLSQTDAAATYVSIAFFERLFKAYNGSTVVHPNNTTSTIDNIKAMFGFWTDFYLSALGNGSGGSTPGVTMAQVWSALGNSTTEQINISHLTTALSGYNPTSNFKTINGNSIIGTGDIVVSGGGGDYLPLSGGTMTGQINSVNIKPTTNNISYIGDASHQYLVAYVGYLNSGANKVLAIASNNGDRDIYIDTSHNIGIGHRNPTTKLDVNGTFNASGNSSIGGTLDVSAATTLSSGLFVTGTNSSNDDGITITLQDKRYIGLILTNGKSSAEEFTAEFFVDTTTKNSQWYFKSDGTSHTITHPNKSGTIALTSDLGSYLPLSGGTMTGTINCQHIVPKANNTYRLGSNSVGFQVLYTTYVNGIANKPLDLAAADGSGDIYITAAHLVGIATKSPSYQLHVNGTFYASGNSSIGGTFGVTGATTLSSTLGVTGAATLSSSLSVSGNSTLSGYVGVGTAASSSYALKVSGVAYASTGVYSGGYVTALSDIRHKDVQGNVLLTVSEVANAPSVKFLWKDRRQEGLQVGSIAQYWKKVMPEAVVENADGELTMSYGVIALLSSIATARKVEDLERRVVKLEKENKLLKEQLNVA